VGVALTAAVGLGLYPNFESLRDVVQVEHQFEPQPANSEVYKVLYGAYQRLYSSLRELYRDVNEVRFRVCAKK